MRSMGSTGVAFSNSTKINFLNPASLGAVYPKSMIFNLGAEGQNFYAKTVDKKTSYNTFNFRDLALQFPLARRLGMLVSVTPLSSVGYRVEMFETDPKLLANVGSLTYKYAGSGGITQAKVSIGGRIFKNLSLGADMIFYHGRISRSFSNNIIPISESELYSFANGSYSQDYSRLWFNLGMQYHLISKPNRMLTLGATYQPKLNLRPMETRVVSSSSGFIDNISTTKERKDIYMPAALKVGLFYYTNKIGAGLDFGMKNWGSLNSSSYDNIRYVNTKSVNAGIQYTPNAIDIRNVLKRWTYRLGARYEDYYLNINGHKINDVAITGGIGFPVKMGGFTSIDVGFEVGRRGSTATGLSGTQQFNMIKESYFKFSVGFSFFGEDYWFQKYKFN